MSEDSGIKEYLPQRGLLHHEDLTTFILCKPKIMPLKSVTLQKLEELQNQLMKEQLAQQEDVTDNKQTQQQNNNNNE